MMRRGVRAVAIATAAMAGSIALASADMGYEPEWRLDKPVFDGGGSAILAPGNDTRANLLLLLADRRGAIVLDPAARTDPYPPVQLSWGDMAEHTWPAATDGDGENYSSNDGTRCHTAWSGGEEFAAAVNASTVPAEEKQALVEARTKARFDCNSGTAEVVAPDVASAEGRAFADYITAAGNFYGGKFGEAERAFGRLSAAPDPWVRETSSYMVARTAINDAQASAIDEYGDLLAVDERDLQKAASAGAALSAYIKAYPKGLYADSARGLMRRVHWLAGDEAALAADYDALRMAPEGAAYLANEVDARLQFGGMPYRDPLLLAVDDLKRMRRPADNGSDRECCGPVLTRDELDRQKPLFHNDTELFDFLRATESWYARRDAREVLRLIPDASHQNRFSYVQFSRQMLRFMALDALGDSNRRQFLLDLLPGATQPYQRGSVELALAITDEKSGALDRVFAPDSQVRYPIFRQLLLERTAGIDLLRRQSNNQSVPRAERDTAFYVLLSKELEHGLFKDFLVDAARIPADASTEGNYWTPEYPQAEDENYRPPPFGMFVRGSPGDTGCPAIGITASALAANPAAVRPRLCYAEFLRENGFDWSDIDDPLAAGLASTPSLFPGKKLSRLEIYKAVMADAAATPDDKAYALNRAVRCYAPVGNNSCGGIDVDLAQRKAWFNRLKSTYPNSPWARDLRYYW